MISLSPLTAQFTKLGGGITASTGLYFNNEVFSDHRTGNPALTLTAIYELNLPFHLSPSFTYFLPNVSKYSSLTGGSSKHVVSCMMFDVNGHYVLNSLDRFEIYALAGLDFTFLRNKMVSEYLETTYKDASSESAIGLNIGAGTYFKLTDQFDIYGEAKYIVSKYDQFVFTAGVLINIDWLIKHQNDTE
jgi:opacity protein-like surface antigen